MASAAETVNRAKTVLRFTKFADALPFNHTEFFDAIIPGLQVAVFAQGLNLADKFDVIDVPTFVVNLAMPMITAMSDTSGPSIALLQSLDANQGMLFHYVLSAAMQRLPTRFRRSQSAHECPGGV